MKFVLIIGDASVGKMTVGQELTKITGLRLYHNHVAIEPVLEVFGEFNRELIDKYRELTFDEFLKTKHEGLIFTFMWNFDSERDWNFARHVVDKFENAGCEIYVVELHASLEKRLERNVTENRLLNKASKRDIESSNKRVIDTFNNCRCDSLQGELKFENYMWVDNENLEADVVAKMIKDKFNL